MYLIKNIYLGQQNRNVVVEDGIEVYQYKNNTSKGLLVCNPYWGKAEFHIGDYFEFTSLKSAMRKDAYLLHYVSDYIVEDAGDGFKEFVFHLSTYEPEKIDGYIIFIGHAKGIETSGNKLYGRYPEEIIAVLKDGDYLKFDDRRIDVINNQLMLHI